MTSKTKKWIIWGGAGIALLWFVNRAKAQTLGSDDVIISPSGRALEPVYFDFDSADIRSDSQNMLNNLASNTRANPSVTVQLIGYTDSTGDYDYNVALSQLRAESVATYLMDHGTAPEQITAIVGRGPEDPIASNDTEEGRALNRRVEILYSA